MFPLPRKVLKHIEAICRNFLWTGRELNSKKAPVAWDKVCDPKSSGGLNVTSLLEWNVAALSKMIWNIHAKSDKLWVKWIHMYFLKGKSMLEYQPGSNCSWIVRMLFKYRDVVIVTRAWVGVN